MKKFFVFTLMLICISFSLSAEIVPKLKKELLKQSTGIAPQQWTSNAAVNDFTLVQNRDLSRYNYDFYTGNTTDLTYNAVDISNGSLSPTGTIVPYPLPMAEEYDGNTIYRLNEDLSLEEVNPDDGTTTALGTISGIFGIPTSLAYDWQSSTMYVLLLDFVDFSPHLATLDLTTLVATEIGVGSGFIIAMDFAADGYLYGPATDDDNLYQIDPATGASIVIGPVGYDLSYGQDVTYDFVTNQLYTISCGFASVLGTYDLTTGSLTQIADMGGDQHTTLVSTVAYADPAAPAAVSDLVVTPDAGGALSCDLSWINPDLTFSGDPLTELLETRVYRDGALVHTNFAPGIGDPDSFTDILTESGLYNYSVVAYNSFGEGTPVSFVTWIGEDVPNVVEDLLLEESNSGDAYLTWVNPTTSLNGGAFNNPISGYHITRNPDNVTFEVIGEVTQYTDNSIPVADYYSYTVTPYNSIGDGGSVTSNYATIGAGDVVFFDDFEAGLGNWIVEQNGQPGLWMIYSEPFPNAYTLPPTSTGNVCGADADEIYPVDAELILETPLDLSIYETVCIQFDNDFSTFSYFNDVCYVDVSIDDGSSWTNLITWEADVRRTHEVVDMTAEAAGQSNVLIRFYSVQPGWDYWWVIDNVGVYGTYEVSLVPPENVQVDANLGIVSWDEPIMPLTENNVNNYRDLTGYNVYLDDMVTPVASVGIDVFEYTYEDLINGQTYIAGVSAVYDEDESEIVEITFTYTGTNAGDVIVTATKLNNNYPNPFNPVTNIAYSIKESGKVSLQIYNIRGQLVKTLVDEVKETGEHAVTWNGKDNSGKNTSSGVYFYKMKAGKFVSTKKMILMK